MQLHGPVVVDQRDPILLQPEVERHRIGFAVRDDLRVEDDDDVREGDFPDLVDRLVPDTHLALDPRHAPLRTAAREDRALPTPRAISTAFLIALAPRRGLFGTTVAT